MKPQSLLLLCLVWLPLRGLAHSVLSLKQAKEVATRLAECGQKNKWKLSIAVVNAEGSLVYFERGDGSYVGSIEAAKAKAQSANAFQRPTSAFVDGVKQGRNGLLSLPTIVAIEGGVPLNLKGEHLGAIGVSGAKALEDELCAMDGLNVLK